MEIKLVIDLNCSPQLEKLLTQLIKMELPKPIKKVNEEISIEKKSYRSQKRSNEVLGQEEEEENKDISLPNGFEKWSGMKKVEYLLKYTSDNNTISQIAKITKGTVYQYRSLLKQAKKKKEISKKSTSNPSKNKKKTIIANPVKNLRKGSRKLIHESYLKYKKLYTLDSLALIDRIKEETNLPRKTVILGIKELKNARDQITNQEKVETAYHKFKNRYSIDSLALIEIIAKETKLKRNSVILCLNTIKKRLDGPKSLMELSAQSKGEISETI